MIKSVPGIGTVVGGISMSALSGASTYAVGQVAVSHFQPSAGLGNVDLEWAKAAYSEAFERGKEFVSDLKPDDSASRGVYEALEKLAALKEKGVITEEEFEKQKQSLLDRI